MIAFNRVFEMNTSIGRIQWHRADGYRHFNQWLQCISTEMSINLERGKRNKQTVIKAKYEKENMALEPLTE